MPAFGPTHDDQTIWNIVAFVAGLKDLTPEQYEQQLVSAKGGAEHEHAHEHSHSDEQHDHADHHHD